MWRSHRRRIVGVAAGAAVLLVVLHEVPGLAKMAHSDEQVALAKSDAVWASIPEAMAESSRWTIHGDATWVPMGDPVSGAGRHYETSTPPDDAVKAWLDRAVAAGWRLTSSTCESSHWHVGLIKTLGSWPAVLTVGFDVTGRHLGVTINLPSRRSGAVDGNAPPDSSPCREQLDPAAPPEVGPSPMLTTPDGRRVLTTGPSQEAASEDGPAASGPPAVRPRPTLAQAETAYGGGTRRPLDIAGFRRIADAQRSSIDIARSVGEVGGAPYDDLVWGDVANYGGGRYVYRPDEVVVRLVRRIDTEVGRVFQVVDISLQSGQIGHVGTVTEDDRPDSWTYDSPSTPWPD